MKRILSKLKSALLIGTTTLVLMAAPLPASAFIVFDPANYQQNLLSAVRALQEVENQVKQLTNEAQMLTKMDLNLTSLGSSVGGDLKSSLGEIQSLLKQADGIALSVSQTESEMKRLFPSQYNAALSNDQSFKLASERWTNTLSAFKRSMALEAKVTETTDSDSNVLSDLLAKSASAVGNLEVQQAGNELTGLNVKQQLQLQTLMVADQRAQSLDRARNLASQQEAQFRFKRFSGTGTSYGN